METTNKNFLRNIRNIFFREDFLGIFLPSYISNILPINSLGIYIHFPFCQKICFYCDFFKTKPFRSKIYLDNVINEVLSCRNYFNEIDYSYFDKVVDSIYMGGGTPNLVNPFILEKILSSIFKNFRVSSGCEITIELNPELITLDYLKALKYLGVNRVSIGVQTFSLFGLRILGRTGNPYEIISNIELVSKFFNNISIDLIYLYPFQKLSSLLNDINIVKSLPIDHISYYALDMYDDKKVIYHNFDTLMKEIYNIQENFDEFYDLIHYSLIDLGFEHYEVSNFAKNKKYSIHNLKYWYYFDYIGFGPSAVSKLTLNNNRIIRITKKQLDYFKKFNYNLAFYETIESIEEIDNLTFIKEILMLSLRTKWGIILKHKDTLYNLVVNPLNFKKLNSFINDIYFQFTSLDSNKA